MNRRDSDRGSHDSVTTAAALWRRRLHGDTLAGMVYIDRTRYIVELEENSKFLFFFRTRRFGKSLIVNQLWCYYDLNYADDFE